MWLAVSNPFVNLNITNKNDNYPDIIYSGRDVVTYYVSVTLLLTYLVRTKPCLPEFGFL